MMCTIARSHVLGFPAGGAVGARLFKFSKQFTAYSIDPIGLKLGTKILDINMHNLDEQDFLGTEEKNSKSQNFLQMSFVHVPVVSPSQKSVSLRSER